MKIFIGILLVIHGLIVAAQSSASFKPSAGAANPAWMNWWPVNLGQSWLLVPSASENIIISRGLGTFWLAAGLALIAAGLAVLGIIIPIEWWRNFALAGAALSILLLVVYFHPFFIIGFGADVILLAALLLKQWPILARFSL